MATKPLQQLEASGQLPLLLPLPQLPPLISITIQDATRWVQGAGCMVLGAGWLQGITPLQPASHASNASLAAKRRKQCRAQEKEIKTWPQLNKKCASHKR